MICGLRFVWMIRWYIYIYNHWYFVWLMFGRIQRSSWSFSICLYSITLILGLSERVQVRSAPFFWWFHGKWRKSISRCESWSPSAGGYTKLPERTALCISRAKGRQGEMGQCQMLTKKRRMLICIIFVCITLYYCILWIMFTLTVGMSAQVSLGKTNLLRRETFVLGVEANFWPLISYWHRSVDLQGLPSTLPKFFPMGPKKT